MARREGGRAEALGRVAQMDRVALREEWRRLYRSEPPNLSRDLLARAIAYRVQERAEGGLSRSVLRKLAASSHGSDKAMPSGRSALDLTTGARLVREWQGKTYSVSLTESGFEHAGCCYRSLSEIARTITGTRWSGPRFFAPTPRSRGSRDG